MKRSFISGIAGGILLLTLAGVTVHAEGEVNETGTVGMSFLKIVPSAQLNALGGSSSAHPTGASSVWSNPALIAHIDERSAQFSHIEWVEGITQEFAAFSTKTSIGYFGLAAQIFDSDDIELRGDYPSSEPLGAYSIKNASIAFSYAVHLSPSITIGATYKHLFEKVSMETARGSAVDLGLTARTPVEGLTVACFGRNYGRMGKLKNERTKLPSDVGFGLSYSADAPGLDRPITLAADYIVPRYGDAGIRLGAEIAPVNNFFTRVGYRSDSDIQNISFGVGIRYQLFLFDVSYTPMKEGFDNTLRITLGISGF